ncbi:penicillin-binding protein 1C [candidate division KSB1 bacterium]
MKSLLKIFKTCYKYLCAGKWLRYFSAAFLVAFGFFLMLPVPEFQDPYSIVTLDRTGELLGASIAGDEQWRFPPVENIPDKYIEAVTCFEDKRFFYHPGVDPLAFSRALWQNIRAGEIVSGGSTLTMQVVRLSRNGKPRTIVEKITEMVLAFRMELTLDKQKILSLYASHAPFGGNVVGIEAASWRYFGREPSKLSWAETAALAVLPNSPALIHPGRNRDILKEKRNKLLDRLFEKGIFDSLTCELSKLESLPPEPYPIPMTAYHLHSRIRMTEALSPPDADKSKNILSNSSRINTTLRKDIQNRAAEIVQRHSRKLARNGIHNAAAIILDVDSGEVLAYVGNSGNTKDVIHGSHVDIITAPRSTGSILKPLLYAGMLQSGELLPSQLVPDIPTSFYGFAPQNFNKTFAGAVPASMALARSLNVPAVRMLQSYSIDRFYALLKKTGFSTLNRSADNYGLSLILGGAEGTLWDITGIYAGLARCVNQFFTAYGKNLPVFFPSNYLINNEDQNLNIQTEFDQSHIIHYSDSPYDSGVCWLTLKAMLEVNRPGEEYAWRSYSSSRKIAWKTGTSYGFRDGWAVGVNPEYAVGVWVGNADGEGRPELTGITTAAPILFELFGLFENRSWFDRPELELYEIEVCAESGHRAGPNCAKTKKELITVAGLSSQVCPYCRIVHCDAAMQWQVDSKSERVSEIRSEKWFVLPPAMEWYYKSSNFDYRPLPPFKESVSSNGTPSMSFIYPDNNSSIYVPVELDGEKGRVVFKAAHRRNGTTVFWHLDEKYLGATRDIHQMALAPGPGKHMITLVDEDGERVQRSFTVLDKE